MERTAAIERVERLVETVATERMPVPVREVWVYGDAALGLDPVDRLDVYVTKDMLLRGDSERAEAFERSHGVKGVGKTVDADWAEENTDLIRTNPNGYAAPEKCLAAHLVGKDEPIHLEVCNSGFENNVTQRLKGARMRESYEQIIDPRGVCLWAAGEPSTARRGSAGDESSAGGRRSDDAFTKLYGGELAFPTLAASLEMLGMEPDEAERAADAVRAYRERQEGASVRGDVV